jgi:hypothetical protein
MIHFAIREAGQFLFSQQAPGIFPEIFLRQQQQCLSLDVRKNIPHVCTNAAGYFQVKKP